MSHGDVLRRAALRFAGLPVDDYDRIAVDPASVTTVELGESGGRRGAVGEQSTSSMKPDAGGQQAGDGAPR